MIVHILVGWYLFGILAIAYTDKDLWMFKCVMEDGIPLLALTFPILWPYFAIINWRRCRKV